MDLLKQSPVIYYTPVENFNHYLCYGFKSGKEESLMVDSTIDTSKMYSPIVKIKSLPQSLKPSPENNSEKYEKKVYVLPKHLDEKVAMLHLNKVGAKLTKLSKDQADYISVDVKGPFKPDSYRY